MRYFLTQTKLLAMQLPLGRNPYITSAQVGVHTFGVGECCTQASCLHNTYIRGGVCWLLVSASLNVSLAHSQYTGWIHKLIPFRGVVYRLREFMLTASQSSPVCITSCYEYCVKLMTHTHNIFPSTLNIMNNVFMGTIR